MARLSDKDLLKALKKDPELLKRVQASAKEAKKNDSDSKKYDKNGKLLKLGESEYGERYRYRWTDSNSKRQQVYADTLDELRRKERQIQKDIEDGIQTNEAESVTIGIMYQKYIDKKKKILRSKSVAQYISIYNAHLKELENVKIRSMHHSDVVNFYLKLVKKNNPSYNQMKLIHNVLNSLFDMCIKDQYIVVNPCAGALSEIKDSCKKTEKRVALTLKQQQNLLAFISQNGYYKHWLSFITVQLLTGMRISEICGLTWDDVDFEKNEIHVNRALQKYKAVDEESQSIHIGDPKTEAGKRMIVMVPDVRTALLKEKEFQEEIELKSVPIKGCVNGKSVTVKDFVFLKTTGFPYCKDEVNHSLRRIKESYNKQETEKAIAEKREPVLIKQLSSHIMRHTFSTRCVESDMNIKVVQSIMGHEDIKTTMNIYTDVKDDKIHKEFEKADIFKLP